MDNLNLKVSYELSRPLSPLSSFCLYLFIIFIVTGPPCVAQTGSEVLGSRDAPTQSSTWLALQARTT